MVIKSVTKINTVFLRYTNLIRMYGFVNQADASFTQGRKFANRI